MTTDILSLLNLIPEPQEVEARDGVLRLKEICLVLERDAAEGDRFAVKYLAECLGRDLGLVAEVTDVISEHKTPVLLRRASNLPEHGYRLTISPHGIEIDGAGAAGIYYATQTLRQCLLNDADGVMAPYLAIRDWPSLLKRAIHYDTKHHQDKFQYVKEFIKELAHYKVNILVWEWEDKFAYSNHPEIGAPGAFTMEQMQALTSFARKHHVQIVPLIQGLGHASYILKHPKYKHLREIRDSNWEFCPLKEGTYKLLFDLYDEAIEATPGSEFLHIGSDETYELGSGEACGCRGKAEQIGKDGLMQIFIRRCVAHVEKRGRKALSWGGRWRPGSKNVPPRNMAFVDSGDLEYLKAARQAGYTVWVYAPNPGIEPLFLPYFPFVRKTMWQDRPARVGQGSFWDTAETIASAAREKTVDGSITTSWDDSGLHNQCWMPRFVCAAEFSWKADGPDIETWIPRFFANYFGLEARNLRELFQILQDSAQFYHDTFERRVWHWGDLGKIHLPDFPREDLEYNNFWRRRYAQLLNRAQDERLRICRALDILDDNLSRKVKHRYDLEIMRTCADLMRHNIDLVLMLGSLEAAISKASDLHFSDRKEALCHLERAQKMIEEHLSDRTGVFNKLVATWERTRLPKGLCLAGKSYIHARERARHFANRSSDMTYLILDEELLDLEGYIDRLKRYMAAYEKSIGK